MARPTNYSDSGSETREHEECEECGLDVCDCETIGSEDEENDWEKTLGDIYSVIERMGTRDVHVRELTRLLEILEDQIHAL